MTTYEIFRCLDGKRAGNVDYLGQFDFEDIAAAESYAESTFDLAESEHFLIEEADDEDGE